MELIQKTRFSAIILGTLLVISQLLAYAHAVEHPFHAHDSSCHSFIQCEKSAAGDITPELPILDIPLAEPYLTPALPAFAPETVSISLARAPPPLS